MAATTGRHPTRSAHAAAVRTPIRDILRILTESLGVRVVAAIFDVNERTIRRWLESESPRLGAEDERHLRDTFQAFDLIASVDDPHVARAWFLGMNPNLDDQSPIDVLVTRETRTVVAAARAYVNAS